MIANGNYMQKEIAYCGERELEDMDYLPVRENVSEIYDSMVKAYAWLKKHVNELL